MPTYDYACKGCGHRFERFEPMGDDGSKPCPKCGKKKARRMLGTGVGLIFKGSGFYTTDYKGGGRKPEAKDGDAKKPAPEKEKKKEEKEPKK